MLREATHQRIMKMAAERRCMMTTSTLLSIWNQDDDEELEKLDRRGQLIPLIEALMPQLDLAQDLKVEPANQNLAMFEILQMAELPLHVPVCAPDVYRLFVDDNFHYMDESERYLKGTYETEQDAVAIAKKIVDEFLLSNQHSCKNAAELDALYRGFGEDPFIVSDSRQASNFSAWQYSTDRCRELFRVLDGRDMLPHDGKLDVDTYAALLPVFRKALAKIGEGGSVTGMKTFWRKLNERFSSKEMEALKPYVARFFDEGTGKTSV